MPKPIVSYFYKVSAPLATISSVISVISASYVASRLIKTSHFGYMTVASALGIIYDTPIMCFRNKFTDVKSVNKKDLLGINLLLAVPDLVADFAILKMYEKQVALPSSILSAYPLLNLAKDKLTPQLLYNSLNDTITIDKGINLTAKDAIKYVVPILCYGTSIFLLYRYQIQKYNNDNSEVVEPVIFASIAAIASAICDHFANKYGQEYGSEALTYLSLVCGLPMRIAVCLVGYFATKSMSFKHDFIDNISDMPTVSGLAALNLFYCFAINYAFTHMEPVSSCALLLSATGSTYSLLLDTNFNVKTLTVYAYTGLAIGLLGRCGIIISNYYTNDDKKFINIVLHTLKYNDQKQIISQIFAEWDSNNAMYDTLNTNSSKTLDIKNYNETLLVILSKLLPVRFIIQNNKDSTQLVITKQNNSDDEVKTLTILTNAACINECLSDKLILVSSDGIQLSGLDAELSLCTLMDPCNI